MYVALCFGQTMLVFIQKIGCYDDYVNYKVYVGLSRVERSERQYILQPDNINTLNIVRGEVLNHLENYKCDDKNKEGNTRHSRKPIHSSLGEFCQRGA